LRCILLQALFSLSQISSSFAPSLLANPFAPKTRRYPALWLCKAQQALLAPCCFPERLGC